MVGLVVAVACGGFGGVAAAADLAVGGGSRTVSVGQIVVDVGYCDLFARGLLLVGGLLQQALEAWLARLDGTHGVNPEGCGQSPDGILLFLGKGL